jgi:carbamoyl-phosphate synthase small subunit
VVREKSSLKAILVLEDGSIFYGRGFGKKTTIFGELVFNTSLVGYQEALTDPSYHGQILMMTYPIIGNYGISNLAWESERVQPEGFVVRELCETPRHRYSNANYGTTIGRFLEEHDIPGISELDTRALTIKTRQNGTMKAILKTFNPEKLDKIDSAALVREVKEKESPDKKNLVADVSCNGKILRAGGTKNNGKRIVVIDCGVKASIIKELLVRGCEVIQVPYNTDSSEIKALKPSGILISNGPGDPAHPEIIASTLATIRELVGIFPMLGICLGHQIIALAFGARTFKLKFGHRGTNQPVKNLDDGKVYITSQNHGFAVDLGLCPNSELKITGINLNDQTVEAMCHKKLPISSVQFHPEASPGPWDSKNIFDDFVKTCWLRASNKSRA